MRYGNRVNPSDVFNGWTVLEAGIVSATVQCRCECGNVRPVKVNNLVRGLSKRCKHCSSKTHGGHHSRLYRIYAGILQRTTNPGSTRWKDYGGRGIKICQDWLYSFENFREWALRNGYDDSLSIDRLDNDNGYFPNNCRWATPKQQSRNTRWCHWITAKGETKTLTEWGEDQTCPVGRVTLHSRLRSGWSADDAVRRSKGDHWKRARWIEAFGEKKTLSQWSRDSRCSVDRRIISKRLGYGWSPEDAISRPSRLAKG